jgi:hypothetical protein
MTSVVTIRPVYDNSAETFAQLTFWVLGRGQTSLVVSLGIITNLIDQSSNQAMQGMVANISTSEAKVR